MPAFNEEKTLALAVASVLAQPQVGELILVDDASADTTWSVMQRLAGAEPKVRLLQHPLNRGKGAALRSGIAQAAFPYVIIQDADLEYDPCDYGKLLGPILSGRADVVFGSRFLGASERRVLYFWHAIGNTFLTTLSNMFTDLNLSDMETCYKVFRREILQGIVLEEDRFGFEPEVTAKVAKMKVRIYEVAVCYHGRTYAEGKKIGWKDGLSAIRCIFKYGMR